MLKPSSVKELVGKFGEAVISIETPSGKGSGFLINKEGYAITNAHVIQGEFLVSDDPDLMLTTILGSCVAACVRDPVAGVGGMNHFLLPGEDGGEGLRYGVQSMELLVNALLRRGARRDRLEVKLFGGARLIDGLTDVGSQNAAFAERFVRDEGLQAAGGSLRGQQARRIHRPDRRARPRALYRGR